MAANKEFADKRGFEFKLLSDPEGAVVRAYDACDGDCSAAKRVTVVIGHDGIVEFADYKFDAETGPAALLESLRAQKIHSHKTITQFHSRSNATVYELQFRGGKVTGRVQFHRGKVVSLQGGD